MMGENASVDQTDIHSEHHVAEALTELVVAGGALTQSVLGAPGLSMQEEA
jgi:hypothetical protein